MGVKKLKSVCIYDHGVAKSSRLRSYVKEGKAVELAPLVTGVPNEFQDGDAISLWDSKVTSATKGLCPA